MDDGHRGQQEVGQFVIHLREHKVELIREPVQIQLQRIDDLTVVVVLQELLLKIVK